ncbi:hypothetical protein Y1Q_0006644 [Alligator mississippiensis]|uniref:Uncharacterized protein n=1 Tax=Alligator mississippiensis TaxID=8496 RepID=A0A151MRJ6_ALLMI|nr:hypothetical protein Y1Q_0006644 [Alligator mississippiensis]
MAMDAVEEVLRGLHEEFKASNPEAVLIASSHMAKELKLKGNQPYWTAPVHPSQMLLKFKFKASAFSFKSFTSLGLINI